MERETNKEVRFEEGRGEKQTWVQKWEKRA